MRSYTAYLFALALVASPLLAASHGGGHGGGGNANGHRGGGSGARSGSGSADRSSGAPRRDGTRPSGVAPRSNPPKR